MALAMALGENNTLRTLDLSFNDRMTSTGIGAFAMASQVNRSLTRLELPDLSA